MRFFIVVVLFLININFAFSESVKVKYLDNFYIKDNIKIEDRLNLFVVKNIKDFNDLVFPLPMEYKRIKVPSFDEEYAILMALPMINKETFIEIKSIENKGNNIFVNYVLKEYDTELPFKITPIKIFTIPKHISNRIYFTNDEIRYDYIDINNQKD